MRVSAWESPHEVSYEVVFLQDHIGFTFGGVMRGKHSSLKQMSLTLCLTIPIPLLHDGLNL